MLLQNLIKGFGGAHRNSIKVATACVELSLISSPILNVQYLLAALHVITPPQKVEKNKSQF